MRRSASTRISLLQKKFHLDFEFALNLYLVELGIRPAIMIHKHYNAPDIQIESYKHRSVREEMVEWEGCLQLVHVNKSVPEHKNIVKTEFELANLLGYLHPDKRFGTLKCKDIVKKINYLVFHEGKWVSFLGWFTSDFTKQPIEQFISKCSKAIGCPVRCELYVDRYC